MTNIKGIIARHRTKLEAAGFLKQATAPKLSPQVAAMRPSLTKARLALQERPPVVQVSPMAILFEATLPKLEPVLVDLGEARSEEIIDRLCEHGKEMIAEHGSEGSKEHLEGLFEDLAGYEEKLSKEGGLEEIIEAYRKLDFEGRGEDYLRLNLGDKIEKLEIIDEGMILLKMASLTTDQDLIHLHRVRNLQQLDLEGSRVNDLTPLSGLISLEVLNLVGTQVSDVTPLSGLINLKHLDLGDTQVSDISPLRGLSSLQELYLTVTEVMDLAPLSGLTSLKELGLYGTQVSNVIPLSGLTSLRLLDLSKTHVSDISPLRGFSSLQELILEGTPVSDVSRLSDLANLQRLYLGGTQVSDVSPLRGLTNLQMLNLMGTQVGNKQVEELEKAIPGLRVKR